MRLYALFALAPLFCACLYVPPMGRRLDLDQLERMEVGSTTRTEALERLGEPNVLQGDRLLLYHLRSGGSGTLLLFSWTGGAIQPLGTNDAFLLLRFDADDRLMRAPELEIGSLAGDFAGGFAIAGPTAAPLPRRTIFEPVESSFRAAPRFDSVDFCPSRDVLAAGDTRGHFWIRDATGQEHEPLDRGGFDQLVFAPDGRTLALIGKTVHLVDAETWELQLDFEGHGRAFWTLRGVASLDFAPDGETVATGGYRGAVKLWEAASGRESATHAAHDGQVLSLDYSPDGALLATSGTDETTRLWRVSGWSEVGAIERRGVVRFSPDGATFALHCGGHVELWSVAPGGTPALGELKDVLLLPYFDPALWFPRSTLAFSPDGRLLAASHGSAAIWDLATSRALWRHDPAGNRLRDASDHDAIAELAFSPGGLHLATAGNDGVQLLDLSPLRPSRAP